jgi:Rab3 GTPase-activating protein regulatory subunit C-terminus
MFVLRNVQFLCRVITHAVGATSTSTTSPSLCSKWPSLIMKIAGPLNVDVDSLTRHHVTELYSSGFDKLAQEVFRSFSDQLLCTEACTVLSQCECVYVAQSELICKCSC